MTPPPNTTQRILANGGNPRGCRAFLRELQKNNPFSPQHWNACIANNPGGYAPNLNPTPLDEVLEKIAELSREMRLP